MRKLVALPPSVMEPALSEDTTAEAFNPFKTQLPRDSDGRVPQLLKINRLKLPAVKLLVMG